MPSLFPSCLTLALPVFIAACARPDADSSADTAADTTGTATTLTSIANVGLQTPESVLYDEQSDVYIVSNINGEPVGHDDNGFISRIRPTGEVEQLKWIDGASDGVTLNAPKGMALRGDTLFVTDIDTVRGFHRSTGAPLGAHGIDGATFLNDLAMSADGALYVSDSGGDPESPSDAVYRLGEDGMEVIAHAPAIAAPNGLVVDDSGVVVVGFSGNTVQRLAAADVGPALVATLPAGQLDGVVRTSDGSLLVSSWEGQAVYRVSSDGQVTTIVENVEAPADIGYDSRRHLLLIPLFNANRIEVREVH